MYPQTGWQSPVVSHSTSSNSLRQGKQLLLHTGRSSFTQELFPWMNCLSSEFRLLFYTFCISFPSLVGASYQLVVHLVPKCSLFTAVWKLEWKQTRTNPRNRRWIISLFMNWHLLQKKHPAQKTDGERTYLTQAHTNHNFLWKHSICPLKRISGYSEPGSSWRQVCFTGTGARVRIDRIWLVISGMHKLKKTSKKQKCRGRYLLISGRKKKTTAPTCSWPSTVVKNSFSSTVENGRTCGFSERKRQIIKWVGRDL